MLRRALLVTVLMGAAASLSFSEPLDVVLSINPIAKLGAVFTTDSSVLIGNPTDPAALITAGLVTTLYGVPAAFLLWNLAVHNPPNVKVWRTISFGTDLGVTLTVLGVGSYTLVSDILNPPGGEDWAGLVGALLILLAIPMGLGTLADTVPFPMEAGGKP